MTHALTIPDIIADFSYDELNRDQVTNTTLYCLISYLNRNDQAEPTEG
jgi:hypothetical protein